MKTLQERNKIPEPWRELLNLGEITKEQLEHTYFYNFFTHETNRV